MKKVIRITTVPITMKLLIAPQMKFMSDQYKFVGVSSAGEHLEQVGQLSGAKTISVNMTRTISPLADFVSLVKLFFIMLKEKPFIVHTHTPKAGILGMMAAKLARVPVRMHTVCGMPLMETKGTKKKMLELVEKLTYACAHKVYPNSKNLMKIIESQEYCDRDKLKVIGNGSSNGVNCNHFSAANISAETISNLRDKLNIGTDDFLFCFVGRIVAAKGIRELIRAFVNLSNTNSRVKLVTIGFPEPDLDPLDEETTHLLNTHPAIRSVPYQNDIRPYLAMSNVFVFPSYREGFPNVVMEAGAMGLPSIVSDINGCNEIIEHGVNGLIVPVKDENALEMAMRDLLDNPGKMETMKKAARPIIESRYSQNFVWKEILNEYRLQEQYGAKQRYVPKFN